MSLSQLKLPFRIAYRYFKAKKSLQAIHIISWISMSAIAVSTAAMIILFSIFNGLEGTVKSLYSSFYPDVKIIAEKGKFFQISPKQQKEISQLNGIEAVSFSIEDMVLLANDGEQKPATLKGIQPPWFNISNLNQHMLDGEAAWDKGLPFAPAIVGLHIAITLKLDPKDAFSSLNIYYPKKGQLLTRNLEAAFNQLQARPQGIFHIQEDFDNQYVLMPLEEVQELLNQEGYISSIEMKTNNSVSESKLISQLTEILGPNHKVLTRYQQNKTLYAIMQSEKWAVYIILALVMVIASFNMVGSLSMLVLEKKQDIMILKSMGASTRTIQVTFLFSGLILSLVGASIGMSIGYLICLGQSYFGWVKLPDGFIMNAYPVSFQFTDFILVLSSALFIGWMAAIYPAKKAAVQQIILRDD